MDDETTLVAALSVARSRIRVLQDQLAEREDQLAELRAAATKPAPVEPPLSPLAQARIDRALNPVDYLDV